MKKIKIQVLFLIFITALLSAQTRADELILTPIDGFGLEYDDNITFEERERNEVEDLIYVLSPGLDIYRQSERLFADVQTNLDIKEYKDETDFDFVTQKYIGTFKYKLTERLFLNWKGSYHRDVDPERDIPERDLGGEVEDNDDTGLLTQKRSARTRKRLFGGVTYRWNEITSSTIDYGFVKRNFKEKGPGDELDSKSKMLKLIFDRDLLPEKFSAQFVTGYHHYNPESKTNRRAEVADIDTAFFTVGGKYYFTERFFTHGHIGLRHTEINFKVPDQTRPGLFREVENNDVGVIGGLIIENEFSETLHGDMGFNHDLRPSSGRGGEVDRTRIDGNLVYQITYELEARLNADINFTDADAGETTTSDLDRDFIRISPILKYQFTPNFSASIRYTYSHEREEEDDRLGESTVSRINTSSRNVIFFGIKRLFPYEM